MRKQRPRVAYPNEVVIKREGEYGVIEFRDGSASTTNLKIGPQIADMTDEDILNVYNDCIRATSQHIRENPYVAKEVPLGRPQIEYFAPGDQWTPRGNVLRCFIETDEDNQAVVIIDDREFAAEEFSRLLATYAGWGMRIEFVPEDDLHRRPALEVGEPEEADAST